MISQVNIYVMDTAWILCDVYVWRSKFNRRSYGLAYISVLVKFVFVLDAFSAHISVLVKFVFVLDAFWHLFLCFSQLVTFMNVLKFPKFPSFFPSLLIRAS